MSLSQNTWRWQAFFSQSQLIYEGLDQITEVCDCLGTVALLLAPGVIFRSVSHFCFRGLYAFLLAYRAWDTLASIIWYVWSYGDLLTLVCSDRDEPKCWRNWPPKSLQFTLRGGDAKFHGHSSSNCVDMSHKCEPHGGPKRKAIVLSKGSSSWGDHDFLSLQDGIQSWRGNSSFIVETTWVLLPVVACLCKSL